MQPDPEAEGRRWLDQSLRDLDDARYARDGERHNLACFLAQQAAEKALKGFIVSRGEETPWGHSVGKLAMTRDRSDDHGHGPEHADERLPRAPRQLVAAQPARAPFRS